MKIGVQAWGRFHLDCNEQEGHRQQADAQNAQTGHVEDELGQLGQPIGIAEAILYWSSGMVTCREKLSWTTDIIFRCIYRSPLE